MDKWMEGRTDGRTDGTRNGRLCPVDSETREETSARGLHCVCDKVTPDVKFLTDEVNVFAYSPPDISQYPIPKIGEFANATGIVAAILQFVPNQPIIFEVCH